MENYEKPSMVSTFSNKGDSTDSLVAVAVVLVAIYGAAATVGAVAVVELAAAGANVCYGVANFQC